MGKEPLVYIIIVNWRRYKDTQECLASLKNSKYKNFRLIVVDNESQEGKAEKLLKKYPFIKMIKNKKNLGYSRANNQGIELALKDNADFLLLLNNDTVVAPNFLNILVDYARANNFYGVLSPKILYYKSDKIWAMGGKLSFLTSIPRMIGQGKPSSAFNEIVEPDYVSGCAFLLNREVIEAVGMLDTRYFAYYEDTDLSFRVKRAGYALKVIPKSIVWHKVSQSTKQKAGKVGETYAYLLAKNGVLFGVLNLEGFPKFIYLLNQYTSKPLLYLIFKVDSLKAAASYLRGLKEGAGYLFRKTS